MKFSSIGRYSFALAVTVILLISMPLKAEDYHIERFLKDNLYFIFNKDIHTIQLGVAGLEWSQPAIELGSSDRLTCSFDDFEGIAKDYRYTVVHCDPTWHQSTGVIQSDYMIGSYTEEYIRDYQQSFNTLRGYTHYSFSFPNENINFSYSGNYALFVYEDDISDPTFIARFYVYERKVSIPVTVGFSKNPDHFDWVQKVNFNIECGSFIIREPHRSLTVMIQQNNKPFLIQGGEQPRFISGTTLYYDFDDKFEFPGNNEFRHVDIRSVKYLTSTVSEVSVDHSEYYVQTHGFEPRRDKNYQKFNDLDGHYQIYVDDVEDPNIEGEYVYVNLHVRGKAPMPGEDLYVCGEFNGWQMNDDNRMVYNYETGEFEANLYLKQGYYNYCYVNKSATHGYIDETFVDGSYEETQNRYSVYVYYQQTGERYCKLIGFTTVNTK